MRVIYFVSALVFGAVTVAHAQVSVPETYGDAMRWYERAAEAGSAKAQFFLGLMYETGSNRERDQAKAAEWYKKAADQGYALAQFKLGLLYMRGDGVERNLVQSWTLLDRAAASGISEAATARDLVAGEMSPEEFDRAKQRSKALEKPN